MCEDYPPFSEDSIKKGFQATIQDDFRWMKSNIKSISLLGNVLLKNYASSTGCYETLLVRNKKLTEGSTSNVFIVKDEIIYTPQLSNELLPGVTRGLLIRLLNQNNLKVIYLNPAFSWVFYFFPSLDCFKFNLRVTISLVKNPLIQLRLTRVCV